MGTFYNSLIHRLQQKAPCLSVRWRIKWIRSLREWGEKKSDFSVFNSCLFQHKFPPLTWQWSAEVWLNNLKLEGESKLWTYTHQQVTPEHYNSSGQFKECVLFFLFFFRAWQVISTISLISALWCSSGYVVLVQAGAWPPGGWRLNRLRLEDVWTASLAADTPELKPWFKTEIRTVEQPWSSRLL